MKRISYIVVVFTLIASCTSRTIYKKPDNLISKEEMIQLWTDLLLANGARTTKNIKAQSKVNYMRFVYKKYNIDSARFMQSNIYYASKVEEYEKMFQEVKTNLKKIKEKYDPLSKDIDPDLPVWKRDSIIKSRKKKKLEKPSKAKELKQDREISLEEIREKKPKAKE